MSAVTRTKPVTGSARWPRFVMIALVLGYAGILILAPLAALVAGVFEQGLLAPFQRLAQQDVISALGRTLWISLIVVVIHALFGTLIAWVMVRHEFRGKALLNSLIDIPFTLSPVVTGYILLLLFGRSGLLAPVLAAIDLQVAFALPGMILATLFVTLPFMIRELIPVMETLDLQQEKAAATLGAHNWTIFWRVVFPALRGGFLYGLTLTAARALGEFGAVLVIGGGIQGRTETATIYIYRALEDRDTIGAFSVALLLGSVTFLLVLVSDWVRHRKS